MSYIRRAEYYSILCDETTDSSHHKKLCLCIRFVHEAGGKHSIREEFLQFQRAEDLTGAGLASQIMSLLESIKLSLAKLVGQGYDGASSMSCVLNGVQACVRTYAPLADYVHCSSHALNFVLNKASLVPEVRDMFCTIEEVTNFLNESAKRRAVVEETLDVDGGRDLVTLCEIHFVERHDAIIVFHHQFANTLQALDCIADVSHDRKAVDKVRSFARAMVDPSFIVALYCAKKVMAETMVLSCTLQKVS